MYETVLIPTDGSDATGAALRHGLELAGRYGATVHALSVVSGEDYRTPDGRDEATAAAERAVEAVARRATSGGLTAETEVRLGVPHEEILAAVDDADADLVVMGTHGRTGIDRAILGSVTERVVRAAEVPVVTVRATDDLAVTDPEAAADLAREELRGQGYDDVAVTDEPYRTSGSWIVPVEANGLTAHAHVDAGSGTVRLARIDEE